VNQAQLSVLAEAASWLRTPYEACADVKGHGVDCAMLLVRVYHVAGLIPAIDPRPYAPQWHLHRDEERFLGWLEEHGARVENPQPADVAVFRVGRAYSHGAIVVAWPRVIHANAADRMVAYGDAERDAAFLTNDGRPRERRFYRVRGLEG
jgi:cell wall-associated NlpC family hydrolase